MNFIDIGIQNGLIRFDDDQNFITYLHQNKKQDYTNPEEKVQAEIFLSLVLLYGYSIHRIKQFFSVQMGSESKQADIVVYANELISFIKHINKTEK